MHFSQLLNPMHKWKNNNMELIKELSGRDGNILMLNLILELVLKLVSSNKMMYDYEIHSL